MANGRSKVMLIFVNVSFSKKSQRGGWSNIEKSAESKG